MCCTKFERLESEEGSGLESIYYYIVRPRVNKKLTTVAAFVVFWFILGIAMILASFYVNRRTDVLLNATRVPSPETKNATNLDDLANCATASLKDCQEIANGSWHIETFHSIFGKLVRYSYFVDDGEVSNCKPLPGNDDMPCSFYVGLIYSAGSLLYAFSILLFSGPSKENMTSLNFLGVGLSCFSFAMALLIGGSSLATLVVDFNGKMVGWSEAVYSFPDLLHFHLMATVGWLCIFSQRQLLVKETPRSSTRNKCLHYFKLILHWTPYLCYFPSFFFFSWAFSHVLLLIPGNTEFATPTCDESCWLTQKTLSIAFGAPVQSFLWLITICCVMWCKHGLRLQYQPHLAQNYDALYDLFYILLFMYDVGVFTEILRDFVDLRFAFQTLILCEVCLFPPFSVFFGFKPRSSNILHAIIKTH